METYQIEITNRERAVILIALGMLTGAVMNGAMLPSKLEGVPNPTLEELRDIAQVLWPEQDWKALRTP